MRGSSSSRYHSFIREAERHRHTLNMHIQTLYIHADDAKQQISHVKMHPLPGTLGSERFSGILHWSTWSFNAFTSSMSPGTLRTNMSVTFSGHKGDPSLYHYRFSMPCSKSVTHVHPVGFKCGLVAESTLFFVCSTSLKQNKNRINVI